MFKDDFCESVAKAPGDHSQNSVCPLSGDNTVIVRFKIRTHLVLSLAYLVFLCMVTFSL